MHLHACKSQKQIRLASSRKCNSESMCGVPVLTRVSPAKKQRKSRHGMDSTLRAGGTLTHRLKDKTKLETLIRIGQIPLKFNSRGKRTLTSDSGCYKKSQTKLWPKFGAAFNQIQFADQDFKSNSTGKPPKSRGSLSRRLLKSPSSLYLHVQRRRAISAPPHKRILKGDEQGSECVLCSTLLSISPKLFHQNVVPNNTALSSQPFRPLSSPPEA